MKKTIKAHEQKNAKVSVDKKEEGSLPTYLLDRDNVNESKVLSNMIKQKRKEKAGKWNVPVEKVKAMSEAEMFQVVKSGKRKRRPFPETPFNFWLATPSEWSSDLSPSF